MGQDRRRRPGGVWGQWWGQTDKQQQFARLIRQGVSNSQACRIVGTNRRTGTRRRYRRTILNTAGGTFPAWRTGSPRAQRGRERGG